MVKMKRHFFFFFNAEFHRVVWTINALLTVCSEMIPFSGNNQNIKMFGVPPNTLPFVMYIMIICHWAILHYNMSFQVIAGRSDGVFWWFPALSEDQEKICRIHQNYLVALTTTFQFWISINSPVEWCMHSKRQMRDDVVWHLIDIGLHQKFPHERFIVRYKDECHSGLYLSWAIAICFMYLKKQNKKTLMFFK